MTAARYGHCDACQRYHLVSAWRTLWLCAACFVRQYTAEPATVAA